MNSQHDYVLRTVEERDVRFIRLWFTDITGALKSVDMSPAELENAFEEGVGFDGSVCGENPTSPGVEQWIVLHRRNSCDDGVTSTYVEGSLPGCKGLTQGATKLLGFLSST